MVDVEVKTRRTMGILYKGFILRAHLDEAVVYAHLSPKLSPPPHTHHPDLGLFMGEARAPASHGRFMLGYNRPPACAE